MPNGWINGGRKRLELRALVWFLMLMLLSSATATAQRLPENRLKTGSRLLKAFESVVADASRATVRIYADDEPVALGTIVDADGWVLTKASQLNGRLLCVLKDGRMLEAELVGVEPRYDLAMLRVEGRNLPTVSWSDQSPPAVGRWLASVAPDELPAAVGVVSVQGRQIPPQRGVLGIHLGDSGARAIVAHVFPDSGAERAGLIIGDVITGIAGEVAGNRELVKAALGRHQPGEFLTLTVVRGETTVEITARMGDEFPGFLDRVGFQNRLGGELSMRRGGFPTALQHDSILRPEDCGGPVVGLDGKVVGINIARAGRTETYALPAGEIATVIEDLKAGRLAPPVAMIVSPASTRDRTASAAE